MLRTQQCLTLTDCWKRYFWHQVYANFCLLACYARSKIELFSMMITYDKLVKNDRTHIAWQKGDFWHQIYENLCLPTRNARSQMKFIKWWQYLSLECHKRNNDWQTVEKVTFGIKCTIFLLARYARSQMKQYLRMPETTMPDTDRLLKVTFGIKYMQFFACSLATLARKWV